ncbi:MAG TPA: penicillin acylase family protein, partial [Candidatus Wallbacteria bacterium]|nr:penicillin acylase family protein [Candidatus Wallbacteria bacterium]
MNKLKKTWYFFFLLLTVFSFQAVSSAADFSVPNDSFNSIRIIRDEYGVPHVYAKNIFDLYFGYGYVTAEDRLFQIEMLRRSVCGTVSEALGKDFIELDKSALRDGYSIAEIEERIKKIEPVCAKLLEMFAMGVNKKIAEFEKTPGSMPYEFKKFGFNPQKWDAAAVASVYIGTMAVRYSDFTSEMDNMNLLNKLKAKFGDKKAMEIFEDVTPINDDNSPTTINETGCSQSYG